MLEVLHIPKLMLKQSLVWYHWFWHFTNLSFDKMIFGILQVSRDRYFCPTFHLGWYTVTKVIILKQWSRV